MSSVSIDADSNFKADSHFKSIFISPKYLPLLKAAENRTPCEIRHRDGNGNGKVGFMKSLLKN